MDDKIFVAGDRGMVGSAIVRALKGAGRENMLLRSRIELDLCDSDAVRQFMSVERPHVNLIAYDDHPSVLARTARGHGILGRVSQFVMEDLVDPTDPRVDRLKDRVYGSEDILKRMLMLSAGDGESKHRRRVRRSAIITADEVVNAKAVEHGVSLTEYCGFQKGAGCRYIAAHYATGTVRRLSRSYRIDSACGIPTVHQIWSRERRSASNRIWQSQKRVS